MQLFTTFRTIWDQLRTFGTIRKSLRQLQNKRNFLGDFGNMEIVKNIWYHLSQLQNIWYNLKHVRQFLSTWDNYEIVGIIYWASQFMEDIVSITIILKKCTKCKFSFFCGRGNLVFRIYHIIISYITLDICSELNDKKIVTDNIVAQMSDHPAFIRWVELNCVSSIRVEINHYIHILSYTVIIL